MAAAATIAYAGGEALLVRSASIDAAIQHQNLLRNIINELQEILPGKPVDKMLSLYMDFARMETPVEQGVRSDWLDNVTLFYQMSDSMRAAHKNLLNPESFFKKVLYVVDEQGYSEMTANPRLGLYTALEKRDVLLLIDGLNELTTDAECKKKFVISLERFINRYPDVKMVVTDRCYSPFPLRLEKVYHLKTMKKEDILHYAKTRSECTDEVLALLTELLDKPSFADLEYTPLLINQLLLALSTHHKLPEDLSELIGIYLEALQAREYHEKRDLNAAPGKLDLFLMKLSMEDHQEKGNMLLRAMKLCAEIMQEYGVQIHSDVCINLAVQLGILQQSDGHVDFILDEYRSYYFIKAMDANI